MVSKLKIKSSEEIIVLFKHCPPPKAQINCVCTRQCQVFHFVFVIMHRAVPCEPEPFSTPKPVLRESYNGHVEWCLGRMLSHIRTQGTPFIYRTHQVSAEQHPNRDL